MKKTKRIRRETLAHLSSVRESAAHYVKKCNDFGAAISNGHGVVIRLFNSDSEECVTGGTPDAPTALVIAFKECRRMAMINISILNAHRIDHGLKVPRLEEFEA